MGSLCVGYGLCLKGAARGSLYLTLQATVISPTYCKVDVLSRIVKQRKAWCVQQQHSDQIKYEQG